MKMKGLVKKGFLKLFGLGFLTLLLIGLFSAWEILPFQIPPVHAEIITRTEGFENWNNNSWTELGNAFSIEDYAKHSGVNGSKMWGAQYEGIYRSIASELETGIAIKFWLNVNTTYTGSWNDLRDFAQLNNNPNLPLKRVTMSFIRHQDGTLWLASEITGHGTTETTVGSFAVGEWIYVEYYFTTWQLICFMTNSTTRSMMYSIEISGLDSSADDYLCFGYRTYSSDIYYIDDIQLTDFSGMGDVQLLDAEDVDDDGWDWVFTDWKYYTFRVTYYANVEEIGLRFIVKTGASGTVWCGFLADYNSNWAYYSNLTDVNKNRFGEPVILRSGSWSNSSTESNATFLIFFNDQCLDQWETSISPEVYANGTETGVIDWSDATGDHFRIYSKGGFTMNFATTDSTYANKMAGGEWCEMYAYNGTSVYNEIWFRDLQHMKALPEIQFYAGYETFSIMFGLDYSVGEGEWLEGLYGIINYDFVSYTGVFASNVWINMTINWNNRGSFVKTGDYVYMFYHGSVSTAGDIGRTRLWADVWFNSINASSTIGGRFNAYEYPMEDNADLWLRWLVNNWGAKDEVIKESGVLADLLGADGEVMSSERIKMVRSWCNITVVNSDSGQMVIMDNVDVLDYTRSPDFPLTGVQTPVFDETKMPTVGNTGVLGAIFSMFSGIGQWLSENVLFGGLNLWGNFVAFLDTIAGWLGAPKFFTNLFAWIGSGFSWLVSSAGYVLTLVADFFILIGTFIAGFISTLGELILSIGNTVSGILDIMGGTIGGAGDLWTTFGISTWLTLVLIFYPIYLIILWEERGMDAVMNQLTMIFGIASWLFNFFVQLIMMIINFITGLIESIPVAE